MPQRPRDSLIKHGDIARTLALRSAAFLLATLIVALVGMQQTGGILAWGQWLDEHPGRFLLWRLALYAAVLWNWMWARRQLLAREPERREHARRSAALGLLMAATYELSHW